MATINHKVKILNEDKTAYDTYHVETNVGQVYDFSKSKWLNEIISDIELELSNVTGGINVSELNERLSLTIEDLESAESMINAIEVELAKKYVKPENGITIEDLNQAIKDSLSKADRVPAIEEELAKVRTDLTSYIDSKIEEIQLQLQATVEEFIATEGQTSVVLENPYNLSTDVLSVQVGGIEQFMPDNYTKNTDENGVTTITFAEALPEGVDIAVIYYGGIDAFDTIITSHMDDKVSHITEEERNKWNEGIKTKLATKTEAGSVKVGNGLNVNLSGELSASGQLAKLTLDTGQVIPANGNDLNDMVDGGFYYGYGLTNAPSPAGYIIVLRRNSTYVSQLFFDNNGAISNNLFRRNMSNGEWQGWVKVLDADDVLDDLTSTDTSSALSANKGRELKVLIDEKAEKDDLLNVSVGVTDLMREISYLKLKQEASDRIEGGVAFADDMNGSRFGFTLNEAESTGIKFRDGKMLMIKDEISPVAINSKTFADTGGLLNGSSSGRKLVMLENGTLITATRSNSSPYTLYVWQSLDNGNSWTALGSTNMNAFNIATFVPMGKECLVVFGSGTSTISSLRITEKGGFSQHGTLATGLSASGEISVELDPANGHLHASWTAKVPNFANSLNVFYAKSTDGGATWSAVEQITSINATGNDHSALSLSVNREGNPVIVYNQIVQSSNLRAMYAKRRMSNGNWNTAILVSNQTAHVQNMPSTAVDKNGTIHATWFGTDATIGNVLNIRYTKSSDGGDTWAPVERLTSYNNYGQSYPSITVDKNNTVYIVYQGGSTGNAFHLKMLKLNGSTWVPSDVLTEGVATGYPSTLYDPNFSLEFTIPPMTHTVVNTPAFTGTWGASVEFPQTTATAVYDISSTSYVGAFVQKMGDVDVVAYINNTSMASELDGNEYRFTGSLATEEPVKLKLELSRTSTTGGENDAITRVLGGRA